MKKNKPQRFRYPKIVISSNINVYLIFLAFSLAGLTSKLDWIFILAFSIILPLFYFVLITIVSGALEILSVNKIKMEFAVLGINVLFILTTCFVFELFFINKVSERFNDHPDSDRNHREMVETFKLIHPYLKQKHHHVPYHIFFYKVSNVPAYNTYNSKTYMITMLYKTLDAAPTVYHADCYVISRLKVMPQIDTVFNKADTATNAHLRDLMKDVDFRNYVRGDTLESMINERKDFVVFE